MQLLNKVKEEHASFCVIVEHIYNTGSSLSLIKYGTVVVSLLNFKGFSFASNLIA